MSELWCKNGIYKQGQLGQATKEKFRKIFLVCRDGIKRANAHLEGTLRSEIKSSKKSFFWYLSSEKQDK